EPVTAERDPPEMRDSIERLVEEVRRRFRPTESDGWLLIPADHPFVEPATLLQLTGLWRQHPGRIIVPTHDGRRGHPTLFPWTIAEMMRAIPQGLGRNWVVRRDPSMVLEAESHRPSVLFDLDTPDDLAIARRLLDQD